MFYERIKANMIARIVASYISTMSDTYAENIFCNLNASKDNYSLQKRGNDDYYL